MYSRYASYLEDGATQDSITFEDFVKLYVNHRPVFGVGKENIQRAFDILAKYCKRAIVGGTADDQPRLPWNELLPMLQEGGEALSSEELNSCLQSLVGDDIEAVVVGSTGPISFADKVLGFEDYEDEETKEG